MSKTSCWTSSVTHLVLRFNLNWCLSTARATVGKILRSAQTSRDGYGRVLYQAKPGVLGLEALR